MSDQTIGILHNSYLVRGGEDEVSMSEFELLAQKNVGVRFLHFVNPAVGHKALFVFLLYLFNITSFFKVYKWLRNNEISLLHVHNWFYKASPAVFWAAKLAKVPVVVTLHNYRLLCPSGTLSFNGQPYLKSLHSAFPWDAVKKGVYRSSRLQTFWLVFTTWLHQLIGTWNIPKTYIVLTKNSLDIFRTSKILFDRDKLTVKPNFIKDIQKSNPVKKKGYFLYVGRLSQEKGIHILLQAFAGLPYTLCIIGNGPLTDTVKQFSSQHSNVQYLGFQMKPFIINELLYASALIFPSIWLETFGLTIIEAFATGTPVIASNQGSASLLVQDGFNGLHFEPENVPDLQKKITYWQQLSDIEKATFSANARRSYEENYTPDKNFEQLMTIYQKAIN